MNEQTQIQNALDRLPTILIEGIPATAVRTVIKTILQKHQDPTPPHYATRNQIPDLLYTDARHTKTEEARDLRSILTAKPARWSNRYCTITYADRLHYAATQTLLKITEEPPQNLRIILFSDRTDRLQPTIKSRSLILKVRDATKEEIEATLQEENKEEPTWRAKICGLDLDTARELDPQITKEWDKTWAIIRTGNPPELDFPYTWAKKLEEQNDATHTAIWTTLAEQAATKAQNRFWREIALTAIAQRETARNGKHHKLATATALALTYALAKTATKSR